MQPGMQRAPGGQPAAMPMAASYSGASHEAIQHHYDLSNAFYDLWLDGTTTYSCALWQEGERFGDLEAAQIRKIDFHAAQAGVRPGDHVLEVGCGWGATLDRLVRVHGASRAVGLTLSEAQLERVRSLDSGAIEVRLENWFDHVGDSAYDAIVSIEAFEAFARPDMSEPEKVQGYREFFARCHAWLRPRGQLSLQTIAFGSTGLEGIAPFIYTDVFPQSNLPHLREIVQASEPYFELVALRNDRQDYVKTLKAWLKNLKANREAAVGLVGDAVVRRYESYLQHSIYGLGSAALNLFRIGMRRLDRPAPR